MSNIASNLHDGNQEVSQIRVNSRRFSKWFHDLERFIPDGSLRDTYMALTFWMNPETRCCWPGVVDLAARTGKGVATVRRHLRRLEALQVIDTKHRRKGCRSNLTNLYYLPVLDDVFLRSRVIGPSAQNDRVILVQESKQQTTTAPTAVAVAPRVRFRPRPENHGARMTFREAWRLRTVGPVQPGIYKGPETPDWSDEQIAAFRERQARLIAERKQSGW